MSGYKINKNTLPLKHTKPILLFLRDSFQVISILFLFFLRIEPQSTTSQVKEYSHNVVSIDR